MQQHRKVKHKKKKLERFVFMVLWCEIKTHFCTRASHRKRFDWRKKKLIFITLLNLSDNESERNLKYFSHSFLSFHTLYVVSHMYAATIMIMITLDDAYEIYFPLPISLQE